MLFKAELVGGSPWGFRLEDGIGGDEGQDRPVRIAKVGSADPLSYQFLLVVSDL